MVYVHFLYIGEKLFIECREQDMKEPYVVMAIVAMTLELYSYEYHCLISEFYLVSSSFLISLNPNVLLLPSGAYSVFYFLDNISQMVAYWYIPHTYLASKVPGLPFRSTKSESQRVVLLNLHF